jgi:S-adenosylmethionine hydrolase
VIALFTDYGLSGPYVGQLKAVLAREAPGVAVLDLQHDAPAHNPRAGAYLLAALLSELEPGTVVVAVVDPGVGTLRRGAIVRVDGRWLVGPDNGLFNVVLRQGAQSEWWDIDWQPKRLSSTFHGRDLFAPVAARMARGGRPPGVSVPVSARILQGWPDDLAEIVYIDRFGNAMTGLRAPTPGAADICLRCRGHGFHQARTFGEVGKGEVFWYANSIGLIELAANSCSVADTYGLMLGDEVETQSDSTWIL